MTDYTVSGPAPSPPPPPAGLQMPVEYIQVSFTDPWETEVWTDITNYVLNWNTHSGRQHELNDVESATANFTLNNRTAAFSPWNSESPFYLDGSGLVPARPIRVIAVWNSIEYSVYYGYVITWMPKFKNIAQAELVVQATDFLGMMNLATIQSQYVSTLVRDGAIHLWRLADAPPVISASDSGSQPADAPVIGTVVWQQPGPIIVDGGLAAEFNGLTQTTPYVGYLNGSWSVETTTAGLSGFTLDSPTLGILDGADSTLSGTGVTTGEFSVEFWFSSTAIPQSLLIGTTSSVQALIDGSHYLTLQCGGASVVDTSTHVNDGKWHQAVLTGHLETQPVPSVSITGYLDGAPFGTSTSSTLPDLSGVLPIGAGSQPIPFTVTPSQNVDLAEVAIYNTELTAIQVLAHYDIGLIGSKVQYSGERIAEVLTLAGVPNAVAGIVTDTCDLAIGQVEVQAMQPGSVVGTQLLGYVQTCSDTELGLFYQQPNGVITFRDRYYDITATACTISQGTLSDNVNDTTCGRYQTTFQPGMDDLDVWNSAIVSVQVGFDQSGNPIDGAEQIWQDSTSIDKYFQRNYPNQTGLLMTSDNEALALAQYIVYRYKDPVVRLRQITMDNTAQGGTYNFPLMLGLQLFDRITVRFGGVEGGAMFIQDSLIEGISHTVTVDTWKTTFALTAVQTNLNPLILDDPVRGRINQLNVLYF